MIKQDMTETGDYPLEDGNKIIWERFNPYGFIYLRLETGELPTVYQGAYNNFEIAKIDMEKYQNERKVALAVLNQSKTKRK